MTMRREREWYAIGLRPRGQHRALRDAVARAGGRLLAMSPLRIAAIDDDATRLRLSDALACPTCIFTSPNAVACAARLQPPATVRAIAVGAGTAMSLRRHGVKDAIAPRRMDSEGVLDLPVLREISGQRLGLVSGSGGRGLIERTLRERGAGVVRADVYRREMVEFSPAVLQRFDALPADAILFVTSAEALAATLSQLDAARRTRMLSLSVIAASERLRDACAHAGFTRIAVAASARPRDLVARALD